MATFNAGAIEATLELDRSPFQRGLELARRQGREFAAQKYTATLDVDSSRVAAQIAALEAQLARLDARRVQPNIDVDTAALMAQLALLQAQLDRIDGRRVSPDMTGGTQEMTAFASATASAGSGMSMMLPLAVALGPALIPGIAGATAALGGFVSMLSAAGGGLATFAAPLIGSISRVNKAQQALTQAQDQSTAAAAANAAAQNRVRGALQAVGDAERGLADARRNAARSVATAEGQVEQAQDNVRRAQVALNQARQDAVQRLVDMRTELRGARLDEEGSELAVREAKLRLDAAMADPNATMLSQQEAQLAYDRALFQMEQARKSTDELQSSVQKAQKAGVAGDSQVKAAKEQLAAAKKAEADAEQNLARTRADGARGVAAAERGLARARQQVAQAQKAQAVTAAALATATKAQGDAMAKLTGPAAKYVTAIDGAKTAWNEFLDATESDTLGVAAQAVDLFTKYLPRLEPVVHALHPVLHELLDDLDRWADSRGMDAITTFLIEVGPPAIRGFADLIGNLAVVFGNLADAFAPIGQDILDWLVDVTGGWKEWSRGLDDNKGFRGFIAYVRETGPAFVDFLDAAWDALLNIGRALAPAALPILEGLTTGLRYIADMDPNQLGLVAAGIELIVGALLLGVSGGTNPAGWLMVLSGLGLGLANVSDVIGDEKGDGLHGRLAALRDTMKDYWEWAGEKWHTMWTRTLKPDLLEIRDTINDELLPAWDGFWPVIEPIVKFLGETLAATTETGLHLTLVALNAGLELMAGAMNLWTAAHEGDIGGMLGVWRDDIKSMGNVLVKLMASGVMGPLAAAVFHGVTDIGSAWRRIQGIMLAPVNWIIDNVLNRLIRAVNGIAKALGQDPLLNEIPHFNVPAVPGSAPASKGGAAGGGGKNAQNNHDTRLGPSRGMATGGVLPGYTPGRDVHTYTSPTAPPLHLSGGEAIMVPEWTRQMGGPAAIAKENARARYGAHFAGGGVVNPDARVTVDGEPMSKIAAAQLLLAEKLSGMDMRVMQGSWQPTTSYSGSSHNGPGVMDTAPGNFAAQSWLRKVGFAAWGRNFDGAAYAGSGAHVHSVSRLDPGARGQSQLGSYAAGGDGLGGRDYGPRPPMLPGLMGMLAQFGDLAVAGGGGGIFNAINPVKRIGNALSKIRGMVGHAPGGRVGIGLATGALDTVADVAREWAVGQAKRVARFIPTAAGAAGSALLGLGKKALHALAGGDSPQDAARKMLGSYGWSGAQFGPLDALWTRESHWNVHADNPDSSAYGIPQALPGSKMAAAGADWRDNPLTQIRWGLGYIKNQYGSPAGAWAHSQQHGWYDNGGWVMPGVTSVLNESGKPEALLNAEQWQLAKRAFGVDQPDGGPGSRDGWTRDDIERLIEATAAANPVVVPQSDTTRELADLIGFELRAQGRV